MMIVDVVETLRKSLALNTLKAKPPLKSFKQDGLR